MSLDKIFALTAGVYFFLHNIHNPCAGITIGGLDVVTRDKFTTGARVIIRGLIFFNRWCCTKPGTLVHDLPPHERLRIRSAQTRGR